MKRLAGLLLCVLLAALPSSARAASRPMTPEELIRSRSVVLFVGGQRVGDLMLGADAKMQFQFIDRKLADGIYGDPNSYPDELVWNAEYIDKAARKKCNLVLLIYRAMNSWTFDPDKITVNGKPLDRKRIYTSLLSKEVGRIAGDTQDAIGFGIPRAESKPGSTIVFGYGDATVEFVVPAK